MQGTSYIIPIHRVTSYGIRQRQLQFKQHLQAGGVSEYGAALVGVNDAAGYLAGTDLNTAIRDVKRGDRYSLYRSEDAGSSLISVGGAPDPEEVFDGGTYTLPAGSIRAGVCVHLRAVIRVTDGSHAASLTVRAYLGGLAGQEIAATSSVDPGDGDRSVIDIWLNGHEAVSSASEVAWAGTVYDIGAAGTPTLIDTVSRADFDTEGELELCVSGEWTGAADDEANIESFLVEITG